MATAKEDVPIGIDLGTTNSGIAYLDCGELHMVLSATGKRLIPSLVSFTDNGYIVGENALVEVIKDPKNTVYETKRLIGRGMQDPMVQDDIKIWPFVVENDGNGKPRLRVKNRHKDELFYPEQIAAMILSQLKKMAEEHLHREVKSVVITIPAAFTDAQRQATIDAAEMADLVVLRIINEPTAAALAYGYLNNISKEEFKKILVMDLGGGTFDVSILHMKKGEYVVLQTQGDAHLGGVDFDSRILDYFQRELIKKYGEKGNLQGHAREIWRLRQACEEAKKHLSVEPRSSVQIENLLQGITCEGNVTRAHFEDMCHDLFDRVKLIITQCLENIGLKATDISNVLLVGGSTRIPKIKKLAIEIFGEGKVVQSVNPDEAVTQGAVLQAALLMKNVQKECKSLVIRDALPRSLGTDVEGRITSFILKRNQIFPVTNTRTYQTVNDNQTAVQIMVLEGEDSLVKNNLLLDTFHITNIPPRPAGEEKIDVTFKVSANGVLEVWAKRQSSNLPIGWLIKRDRKQFTEVEKLRHQEFCTRNDTMQREKAETCQLRLKLEEAAFETRKQSGLKNFCDDVLDWLNDNPSASKDELVARIQKFEGIATSRQAAQDELANRIAALRVSPQMKETCNNLDYWMKDNIVQASAQEYREKLVCLEKVFASKTNPLRSRVEDIFAMMMKPFSNNKNLMTKCEEVQNWPKSDEGRGSADDSSFVDKMEELNDAQEEWLQSLKPSASNGEEDD